MKKYLAIVLSLMMLLSFSVFAAAEEEPEASAEGTVPEETSEEAAPKEEAEAPNFGKDPESQ